VHTVDSRVALPLSEPKAVDNDTGWRERTIFGRACAKGRLHCRTRRKADSGLLLQCLIHTHGALGRGEGRVTS